MEEKADIFVVDKHESEQPEIQEIHEQPEHSCSIMCFKQSISSKVLYLSNNKNINLVLFYLDS